MLFRNSEEIFFLRLVWIVLHLEIAIVFFDSPAIKSRYHAPQDRVVSGKINSVVFNWFSGFRNNITNLLLIRPIDHAFIPLFFHWSKRFIKTRLVQDGFIYDLNGTGFPGPRTFYNSDTK
jgi:hypothetical protein